MRNSLLWLFPYYTWIDWKRWIWFRMERVRLLSLNLNTHIHRVRERCENHIKQQHHHEFRQKSKSINQNQINSSSLAVISICQFRPFNFDYSRLPIHGAFRLNPEKTPMIWPRNQSNFIWNQSLFEHTECYEMDYENCIMHFYSMAEEINNSTAFRLHSGKFQVETTLHAMLSFIAILR